MLEGSPVIRDEKTRNYYGIMDRVRHCDVLVGLLGQTLSWNHQLNGHRLSCAPKASLLYLRTTSVRRIELSAHMTIIFSVLLPSAIITVAQQHLVTLSCFVAGIAILLTVRYIQSPWRKLPPVASLSWETYIRCVASNGSICWSGSETSVRNTSGFE